MIKKYFFLFLFLSLLCAQENEYQIIKTSNDYVCASIKEQLFICDSSDEKWHEIPLTTSHLIALCFDNSQHLWLLKSRKLICYNIINKKQNVILLPQRFEYLPPSIFVDVGMVYWKNKIWIAASEKLWAYYEQKKEWSSYEYPVVISGGQILIDSQNKLWLKGKTYFDGAKWSSLPIIPVINQKQENNAFTVDAIGRPWVINNDNIYFFDFSLNKWMYPMQNFSRPTAIAFFQNAVWTCDYGKGIFKFNSDLWQHIKIDKERPSLPYTYQLIPSNKRLWINTYYGIGSFDGDDWISHFDATQYNSVTKLFYLTLASIILLLMVSIIMVFVINRIKKVSYEKNH